MPLKNNLFITFSVLLVSLLAFSPPAQEFGKITLPLGIVEVRSPESSEWVRAKVKQPVYVQDRIRTKARSRAEITLTGGGKMRMGENSELELTEASVKPMKKDFNANLSKGKIWVSAKAAFGEKKNVAIRTPTAVAAIRGTKYRVEAGEEESSVLVYDGKVDVNWVENVQEKRKDQIEKKGGGPPKFKLGPVQEVEAPEQVAGPYEVTLEEWITLVEGMQINIRKDGKYYMFEFDKDTDSDLDWVKWNKERDGQE
ncbi:MAG: FecR domain-containing protein [Candidatus Marinimicrobia bacterium]|nr:FecR domain-containing protein [Candidatus Neomarinimicrobiota bacterium]